MVIKESETVNRGMDLPPAPHRPRAEAAAKKTKVQTKPPEDPDTVFPCKKCGRYKYKSMHVRLLSLIQF